MSYTHHEELHRGADVMAALAAAKITLCGAGALGANLAENLARAGCRQMTVIDDDRIEERNLSTQPYMRADIGAPKARILANNLYRAVGAEVEDVTKRLDDSNVKKLLRGSDLVLDCFDNSVSRRNVTDHCLAAGQPCLHVGLAEAYAEIVWNEVYTVPSDANDDVCDYPLTRNLVLMAVAVAAESAIAFLANGTKQGYSITLTDFAVRAW